VADAGVSAQDGEGGSARAEFERLHQEHERPVRRDRDWLLSTSVAAAFAAIGAVALNQPLLWLIAVWFVIALVARVVTGSPQNDQPADPRPFSSSVPTPLEERFMPPVRREHIRLAREARARATDQRTYWTKKGLAEGKAPPMIRPDRPD